MHEGMVLAIWFSISFFARPPRKNASSQGYQYLYRSTCVSHSLSKIYQGRYITQVVIQSKSSALSGKDVISLNLQMLEGFKGDKWLGIQEKI